MTPAESLAKSIPPRRAGCSKSKQYKRVFACAIGENRRRLRLSIHRVAKAVGMSVSGMFAIEQGTDPMLSTAFKLAKFYGCDINELWRPIKEPTP